MNVPGHTLTWVSEIPSQSSKVKDLINNDMHLKTSAPLESVVDFRSGKPKQSLSLKYLSVLFPPYRVLKSGNLRLVLLQTVNKMALPRFLRPFLLVLLYNSLVLPVTAKNFKQCMEDIRNGTWGSTGITDNNGNPVQDFSSATAITYDLCVRACGAGPQPFQWSTFSQQFSAWLLPWLALVSQLPFGAKLRQDNFISMILTVGSPTLAAFSLSLTALNEQWVNRRFGGFKYPNMMRAVHVLKSLQQVPLNIVTEGALLGSLVVLPENDEWWRELSERLDYNYTWSLSSATSITWVIVAYIFTVIDSFTNITAGINSNGQGVGSAWLWLLPIVTGWLQISPKCDYDRVNHAIKCANNIAFVATHDGIIKAGDISEERAISLQEHYQGSVFRAQECSPPIFNYARFLSWVQAVEDVRSAFYSASMNANAHIPVNLDVKWGASGKDIDPVNRTGTASQVETYCKPLPHVRRSQWGPGVISRFVVASLIALGLQWGTTGAAIIVMWYTPTRGLGCRSGSYLLYAALSTIVWILLVISAILTHYATLQGRSGHRRICRVVELFSIFFRRLGNLLATCNAIWIIVACLFQFSNFFDRCYCDSSVLGLGRFKAYDVMELSPVDVSIMKKAWIGGVVLASGCASLFVGFVYTYINPPPLE